jgi:hypothetical protein
MCSRLTARWRARRKPSSSANRLRSARSRRSVSAGLRGQLQHAAVAWRRLEGRPRIGQPPERPVEVRQGPARRDAQSRRAAGAGNPPASRRPGRAGAAASAPANRSPRGAAGRSGRPAPWSVTASVAGARQPQGRQRRRRHRIPPGMTGGVQRRRTRWRKASSPPNRRRLPPISSNRAAGGTRLTTGVKAPAQAASRCQRRRLRRLVRAREQARAQGERRIQRHARRHAMLPAAAGLACTTRPARSTMTRASVLAAAAAHLERQAAAAQAQPQGGRPGRGPARGAATAAGVPGDAGHGGPAPASSLLAGRRQAFRTPSPRCLSKRSRRLRVIATRLSRRAAGEGAASAAGGRNRISGAWPASAASCRRRSRLPSARPAQASTIRQLHERRACSAAHSVRHHPGRAPAAPAQLDAGRRKRRRIRQEWRRNPGDPVPLRPGLHRRTAASRA